MMVASMGTLGSVRAGVAATTAWHALQLHACSLPSGVGRALAHLQAAVTKECTWPIISFSADLASGAHAILNSSMNLPDTAARGLQGRGVRSGLGC